MIGKILFAVLLTVCLVACAAQPTTLITPPPDPTRAAPTATQTVTLSPTPTTPPATPTQTATPPPPTATGTNTPTPTPQATFDTLRKTPPTLMLHKSNPDFDAVAFLKGFVKILKQNEIRVVTYQIITDQPDITAAEQGRLFIITIDDVSLQAPIDDSIQEMIAILREAGYPAVLGIVTEGKLPDDNTAQTLKELASEGWELAMHTENHTNLHVLEQTSSYGARLEIRTCNDKIFQATGVRPITLVLPYGDMVENLKILYRENVRWSVGIVGGEKYRTTNQVYYVGRESPAGDPQNTYNVMLKRFN